MKLDRRLTKNVDAHYSPDDGGWYAACELIGCGWQSRGIARTVHDLYDEAINHDGIHAGAR